MGTDLSEYDNLVLYCADDVLQDQHMKFHFEITFCLLN